MMTRDKVMRSLRHAGAVQRYHTWPTLQKQTNADHTYNVLRIYFVLFGPPSIEVVQYIMFHDSGEIVTGDLPFPFKKRNPQIGQMIGKAEKLALETMGAELPALDQRTTARIKLCDLAEMHEFGIIEMMMGNQYAEPIVNDTGRALAQLLEEDVEAGDALVVRSQLESMFLQLKGDDRCF